MKKTSRLSLRLHKTVDCNIQLYLSVFKYAQYFYFKIKQFKVFNELLKQINLFMILHSSLFAVFIYFVI